MCTQRPSIRHISRNAMGHRRDRSTTSSTSVRAFVCAKSAETFPAHRGTSVHRLCTQSLHTMQHVQPNGRRSIPYLGMIWAIVGGRSTTSSAALRAFVCAKSAETFPAHRGTSVHRLCTQSLHTMQRVQPNGRRSALSLGMIWAIVGLFDNIVGCLACVRVRKECAKSALHVSARIERFESVTPGVTLPKR